MTHKEIRFPIDACARPPHASTAIGEVEHARFIERSGNLDLRLRAEAQVLPAEGRPLEIRRTLIVRFSLCECPYIIYSDIGCRRALLNDDIATRIRVRWQ